MTPIEAIQRAIATAGEWSDVVGIVDQEYLDALNEAIRIIEWAEYKEEWGDF